MTPRPKPSRKPLILCVEDEPDLLGDIVEELEEAGYDTMAASDGNMALEKMKIILPDLVLCDVSMPGLDGFGLLEALQAADSGYPQDIPFLFLTALSDPRQVVAGKRLGADDYLVKPIDYDLLLATVEARLRQVQRVQTAYKAQALDIDSQILIDRFGLTPTEVRIAIALAEGKEPSEIASGFNISRTTVAFHIRNLFGKTHTNRQAELVAVLLKANITDS